MRTNPDRRSFLKRATALVGTLALGGCDRLSEAPWFRQVLDSAESASLRAQRVLLGSGSLAREYTEAELSPVFKANGSTSVDDFDYQTFAEKNFVDWRLQVDGLVERPQRLSLAELRAMPSRTQITRHDCVEGWSCIGKWTGVPLAHVLEQAGVHPRHAMSYSAAPIRLSRPWIAPVSTMRASGSRMPTTRRRFWPTG
jgi:DMSO/TMAO reductase YedYZ molybdopterin-dependent catalytic subunit